MLIRGINLFFPRLYIDSISQKMLVSDLCRVFFVRRENKMQFYQNASYLSYIFPVYQNAQVNNLLDVLFLS